MKKMFSNIWLLTCTIVVLLLIPLFLSHDLPIAVHIPQLTKEELVAKKEATEKAEQEAARKARLNRIYSCKQDDDCLIVDKDPCGCAAGPSGVVAINVNYITDFNALNGAKMVTKACSPQVSTIKECSASARAVCNAHRCKITY